MQSAALNTISNLPLAALWNGSGPPDGEWWWIGRIAMFLVLIALVALAIWWSRRYTPHHEISGLERARNILAERYARGEIDGDEYRERLADLE